MTQTRGCPVPLGHIIGALCRREAREMTENDRMGFAGVEGDGFLLELQGYLVVIDVKPGTTIQVMDPDGDDWWSVELADDLDQIGFG